jgi:hypothetical protein
MIRERNNRIADAQEDQITSALLAVIENDLRQTGRERR